MKNFTFKTEQPVGKYRSFDQAFTYIKLDKKEVGSIAPANYSTSLYRIRLMVVKSDINEDNNPNCTWKWVTIKKDFSTILEAKNFLLANSEKVQTQLNLFTDLL